MTLKKNHKLFAGCLAVLFALLQVVIIREYYFRTGWDVQSIEELVFSTLTGSELPLYFKNYFSRYPNNLFLAFIWLCSKKLLGLFSVNEFFCVIAVNIALFQMSAYLLYDSLFIITMKRKYAYFGFFLYELLTGLSPWMSIPYSDTMGLIFPVLTLWISLKKPEKTVLIILKWFSIGLIAYAAYSIKPQASFMSIAVVLCHLYRTIRNREHIKNFAATLLPLAAGILCSVLIVNAAVSCMNVEIDREKTFSPVHWLMIGMNTEANGRWIQSDEEFSMSFETRSERNIEDIEMVFERIRNMGFPGLLKHLMRKTEANYGDGTFAWWGEGNFVIEYFRESGDMLCYLTRNLFYESGSLHGIWKAFCQVIWLPTLFLSFLAISGKRNAGLQEILMTLLGVFIFSLLFETRARYLLVNTPIFIAAATIGLQRLISIFKRHENPLRTA